MNTVTIATESSKKAEARELLARARRVAVLGAGVSGRAAARMILRMSKSAVLFDDQDLSSNPEVAALVAAGAETRWAAGTSKPAADALDGVDAVVPSPGIPDVHPLRAEAVRRGLLQLAELELGWMQSGQARTIAITGTNGKTTVTMLTRHILANAGLRAVEAGNIGMALCDAVLQAGENLNDTTFVTEVSSFQLETIHRFAPEIAAILNITPDHLDRHGAMEGYAASKRRITENQSADQVLVVNQDDPLCLKIAAEGRARVLSFSLDRPAHEGAWLDEDRLVLRRAESKPHRLLDLEELPLFGLHNVANALAAACAASAMGVGHKAIAAALRTFKGAPHRLEHVATIGGVDFFNDSKATNIDALVKAVASFARPVHLIAGGRDKDSPFGSIVHQIEGRVAAAYLIGEAADKIERAWSRAIETRRCGTLEAALEAAAARAEDGEIVLLAPGCASFDQFKNYAHRGEGFRAWVRQKQAQAEQEVANR